MTLQFSRVFYDFDSERGLLLLQPQMHITLQGQYGSNLGNLGKVDIGTRTRDPQCYPLYYPLPTLSMDYIRRRRRIDKRSKIRYSQEDKEEEEEEEEEK